MAVIEEDLLYKLDGDMYSSMASRGARVGPVQHATLLPPVMPSKIICVGRNYVAHAQELGNDVPAEPLLFFKPPSSLIGAGAPIEILPQMGRVEHEAELVVVIGRRAWAIPVNEALNYVLGYCCANDVTDRDFQKKDDQWARAKGFNTFCPLGPWINTSLDPTDVMVRGRVNGELRQEASTRDMVFNVPFLVAHASHIMTLEPGDIILTGTPAGVGPIKPGDQVEIEVEGIGVLSNPVVARSQQP
jgi:2-keto-4-pentenoate hydratase/2-oxohepta-3-ene-1,7-dioic acid hydratase in catechol pathway